MFHTQIDTSYLIGIIVTIIFLLIFGAAGLIWWLTGGFQAASSRRAAFWQGLGISVAGWALTIIGFVVLAFPPLPGQYNEYQPVSGVVKQVSSRFIASDTSGGGSTQKFAVQLANGSTYGCNDTRCSVLKPGEGVTLLCEKVFQFNSAEGWDCNFGKYGLNGKGS